jgi:glycosyltransferase involved in cell wall biosynthesis
VSRSLRVLLVPDVPYWICGTIARAIAAHAPGIEATICSGRLLRSLPNLKSHAGHFDVVHFLTPQDANKSLETFRGRIATVTTIHHVQDESSLRSVPASDMVMTASQQWYGRLVELGVAKEKLAIVPYGIDTDLFRPTSVPAKRALRERLGLDRDRFTVGFVGKRSSDAGGRKGTDVFVEGIRLLAQRGEKLQVLVIGPGWESFSASLRDLGVPCVWKPFVLGETDFAAVYHAMDVYGCTSTIEGGPVPVLEAMASGLCCLATAVGMVPELICDGKNGVRIPFDDSQAFAVRVADLIADPVRCAAWGAAAAATIRTGYRWEQSARHAVALYERARCNFAARQDLKVSSSCFRAWPAAWIEDEERRLTEDFIRDAHHPPAAMGRVWRTLRDSRWTRSAVARWRMG